MALSTSCPQNVGHILTLLVMHRADKIIRFLYTVALDSNCKEQTVFLHHGARGSYMCLRRMKLYRM